MLVRRAPGWQGALHIHLTRLSTEGLGPRHGEVPMLNAALRIAVAWSVHPYADAVYYYWGYGPQGPYRQWNLKPRWLHVSLPVRPLWLALTDCPTWSNYYFPWVSRHPNTVSILVSIKWPPSYVIDDSTPHTPQRVMLKDVYCVHNFVCIVSIF